MIHKRLPLLLCVMLALALVPKAFGQLSGYTFTYSGAGTAYSMVAATTIYDGAGQRGSGRGGYYNAVSAILPIGFAFNFAGTDYTEFSVSTNGLMRLGSTVVSNSNSNSLAAAPGYPILAPFWDYLRVSGGVQGCASPRLHYATFGASPNRVLVVEWRQVDLYSFTPTYGTFQVRLFECSNKIEFYYSTMSTCDVCFIGYGCGWSTSATIGIANGSTSFMSVTPTAGNATASQASANNNVNLVSVPINANALYTFNTATAPILTGRTGSGNGGTVTMANGDTFFSGFVQQVGTTFTYRPFTIKAASLTCSSTYSMAITGPAASNYYFGTPGTQSVNRTLNVGQIDTVGITFAPGTTTGARNAVLTVTAPGGFTRTYNLSIYVPLINYTGFVAQGGTSLMNPGDTLFKGVPVLRHTSQCFTPFRLTNVSASNQPVDYTLNDPTGQYTISQDTVIGASGGTTTPVICFSPTGFGPQPATLTVNAGGEIRTFTLLAISAAPGGDLRINDVPIDTTMQLFRNAYGCVGEEVVSIPITMVNTGYNEFRIESVEFYQVDTLYGQGVPAYPYLRDNEGNLSRLHDYIITEMPAVAPVSANQVNLPIVVPEGGQRTIYLSFVASKPGKRFAHALIRTNGQSSAGPDTNGVVTEGILAFNVYARGASAQLSDRPGGALPMSLQFGEQRIGEQSTRVLYVVNNGVCPLRIGMPAMEIITGDVDEFTILTRPSSNIDPVTNDLVLAPGARDSVEIRFIPSQQGSRRASLRLKTSDSTIQLPGITERGVYYVDLFGQGKADFYADSLDLGTALIGGGAIEHKHGIVRVRNTRNSSMVITGIVIEGTDAADFVQDPTKSWPRLPYVLQGGNPIELGIEFAPGSGAPGPREATMKIYLSSGDSIVTTLRGTAGTRTLAVNPSSVNFSATSGGQARKMVVISNTGTMPIRITNLTVSNPDFTIGTLERTEIQPTGFESVEITFTPQGPGTSTDQLVVASNGTNGPQNVALNGTASTRRSDDPSGVTTGRPEVVGEIVGSSEEFSVSGVTGVRDASGLTLLQSVPNPGRDVVEIGWVLPQSGMMELVLFDGAGRAVRVLESGVRMAGEGRLRVDVSGLSNGVYHYRLTAGGRTLSRILTIAR